MFILSIDYLFVCFSLIYFLFFDLDFSGIISSRKAIVDLEFLLLKKAV